MSEFIILHDAVDQHELSVRFTSINGLESVFAEDGTQLTLVKLCSEIRPSYGVMESLAEILGLIEENVIMVHNGDHGIQTEMNVK